MPENLRRGRNVAITLAWVEFACCILCFGFYDLRRSRVLLAIIILTLLETCLGLYAKVKLSYGGLLAHSTYNMSIIGGFYIYIMIDSVFGTDTKQGGMSDFAILLVSSLPMLGLFIMGVYSCCLAIMVEKELEERKKVD